jgi:hypothetical protein
VSLMDFLPVDSTVEVDPKWHSLIDFTELMSHFPAITTRSLDGSGAVMLHGPRVDVDKW